MITPSPKHMLLVEALEDVTILCEDNKKTIYWAHLGKGESDLFNDFFGFHPDCLPDSGLILHSYVGYNYLAFRDENSYEFSTSPEEFRGLVRVTSQEQ